MLAKRVDEKSEDVRPNSGQGTHQNDDLGHGVGEFDHGGG